MGVPPMVFTTVPVLSIQGLKTPGNHSLKSRATGIGTGKGAEVAWASRPWFSRPSRSCVPYHTHGDDFSENLTRVDGRRASARGLWGC